MSLFNLTPSKSEKSQAETAPAAAEAAATRARELHLPVDIYEGADELMILADLPGVEPEGLSVKFDAPELRIEGRRGAGEAASVYARTFRVSEQIDPSGITAELASGVLKLRLAKAAQSKPRRIEVRAV